MKLKKCFKDCPSITYRTNTVLGCEIKAQFCSWLEMKTDNAKLCSLDSIKSVIKYLKEMK